MFSNIGGKIKTLAKVVCWIGIVFTVIFGIASIVTGGDLSQRGYMQEGSTMRTSGWMMLILGPVLSWVGSFVLYGFGELITLIVSIDEKMGACGEVKGNKETDAIDSEADVTDTVKSVEIDRLPLTEKPKEKFVKESSNGEALEEDQQNAEKQAVTGDQLKNYKNFMDKPFEERRKTTTRPVSLNNDEEKCELCGTVQRSGRKICMQCSATFIRDDT